MLALFCRDLELMPTKHQVIPTKYWTIRIGKNTMCEECLYAPCVLWRSCLPLQSKVSVTDTSLSDRLARKPPVNEKLVPEPLLDSAEAAAIIKIHPKTLQRLARNGQIRGVQVGRLWRFRGSEIENWIQQKLAG